MKRMTWLVLAAVFALSLAGLTACGSDSGQSSGAASASASSAASASASSAAAKTDEDLIKEDFAEQVDAFFSPEVVSALLGANEELTGLFDMLGIDAGDFADTMRAAMKLEPKSVEVEGDEATLTAEFTVPDFEAGNDLLDQKMEEKAAGVDTENMGMDEIGAFMMDVIREALTDPAMPTTTSEIDIDYEKVDGTWTMADEDELSSAFESVASSVANAE